MITIDWSPTGGGCTDDDEPNDSWSDAQANLSFSSFGSSPNSASVLSRTLSAGETDWAFIPITVEGNMDVEFSSPYAAYWEVYAAGGGNAILSGHVSGGGDDDNISYHFETTDGTGLYFAVYADGAQGCSEYEISCDWTPIGVSCSDNNEPNDTWPQAQANLAFPSMGGNVINTTITSRMLNDPETDWVYIPASQAGAMDLNLTTEYPMYWELYKQSGPMAASGYAPGSGSTQNTTWNYTTADGGGMYMALYSAGTQGCVQYQVNCVWTPNQVVCNVNPNEPNDSWANAVANNLTGTLGGSNASGSFTGVISDDVTDNMDIAAWTFPIPYVGVLTGVVSHPDTEILWELYESASGSLVANGSTVGSPSFSYSVSTIMSGLYLHTYSATGADCDAYSVDWSWSTLGNLLYSGNEPCDAIPISTNTSCIWQTYSTIGNNSFGSNSSRSSCTTLTGSTNSGGTPQSPKWFVYTQPASGSIVSFAQSSGHPYTDLVAEAFVKVSGNCASGTEFMASIGCSDSEPTTTNHTPEIDPGVVAGTEVYIAVWEWNNNNNGNFQMCVSEGGSTSRLAAQIVPEIQTDIILKPNPTYNDLVTVVIPKHWFEVRGIEIIGMDGRVSQKWDTQQFINQRELNLNLDATRVPEGISIIRVWTDKESSAKRIMIVR